MPNPGEEKVFRLVGSYGSICAADLLKEVSISKSALIRILNRLIEQKLIVTNGAGPSVCYSAR
ncbi:winged helix-turn-helix domain-containing protein [Allobaculum mucilyticum]|uniref:winged helix-turn-helix domain-containing protein n=1 Tax=Allobaculum mucilyticum TaxID=2834459 RepID=UPI001E450D48|nr:winged helix-turn-helix domain-containing protein [Allobaculum mucilyticum]